MTGDEVEFRGERMFLSKKMCLKRKTVARVMVMPWSKEKLKSFHHKYCCRDNCSVS